jgi:hypothetical protein
VKSASFSTDGKRALTGGSDATVRLWDVTTGQELARFARHEDSVAAVAFSADGLSSVSGSRDGVLRIWTFKKPPPAATNTKPPTSSYPPDQPAESPIQNVLRPLATIPIGGTLTGLSLSPDRTALFYLNLTDGKAGRIDLATLERQREVQLADGTEVLILRRDGKWLYSASATGRNAGQVQVIDPAKLEVTRSFPVPAVPYDLVATDSGLLLISGGAGDWTEITVVDAKRGSVAGRWGGVWTRSLLQLSPEQDRLYVSTQGVRPGVIEVMRMPASAAEKPAAQRSPAVEKWPLGGEFQITPDGKYLLCKTGTVLRLRPEREEDLKFAVWVGPFATAAVAPEAEMALLLHGDGTLRRYSYPDWKPRGTFKLATVAYQAVLDAREGRLYVAGFDPAVISSRPRARAFGDIQVYDVKSLLGR